MVGRSSGERLEARDEATGDRPERPVNGVGLATVDNEGRGRRQPTPGRSARSAGEPKRVSASLAGAASVMGADGALELADLARRWATLVGDDVAAHSWPVSLKSGALALGTDHHAWASELRLLSGDLVARLRASGFDIASLTVQVSPWEGRGW
jgi:predicted nucleic acid-binding Zn ribbon protein